MRKPWTFLFSTLTIATVMLPALAGTASSAVPNDDDLKRELLRVPLPGDDSDLKVITADKYKKLSEAFCTKDEEGMSAEMLAKIDKAYKTLPVTFGKPDAPKDPIGEARSEVLGTADLTNEARNKLCENADARADYYKALVRQIKKAGTTPVPKLREEGLTAAEKSKIKTKIWNLRLEGFKHAFGNLLSANDV